MIDYTHKEPLILEQTYVDRANIGQRGHPAARRIVAVDHQPTFNSDTIAFK